MSLRELKKLTSQAKKRFLNVETVHSVVEKQKKKKNKDKIKEYHELSSKKKSSSKKEKKKNKKHKKNKKDKKEKKEKEEEETVKKKINYEKIFPEKSFAAVKDTNSFIREKNIKELEENGYTIVEGVLSPEECQSSENVFYEWIEGLGTNLLRTNFFLPENQKKFVAHKHGIIEYPSTGNSKPALAVRTKRGVAQVFGELWGCTMNNLITSMDRIQIGVPSYPENINQNSSSSSSSSSTIKEGEKNEEMNGAACGSRLVARAVDIENEKEEMDVDEEENNYENNEEIVAQKTNSHGEAGPGRFAGSKKSSSLLNNNGASNQLKSVGHHEAIEPKASGEASSLTPRLQSGLEDTVPDINSSNGSNLSTTTTTTTTLAPNKKKKKSKKIRIIPGWTHTDQDSRFRGLQCIQGFVTLKDIDEKNGGSLFVLKGSHKLHNELFKKMDKIKKSHSTNNWVKLPKELDDWVINEKKCEPTIVRPLKAGSMILWDSRILHANVPPTATIPSSSSADMMDGEEENTENNNVRLGAYICMLPRDSVESAPRKQIKRKRDVFMQARTTSHWPNIMRLFSETVPFKNFQIDKDTFEKYGREYVDAKERFLAAIKFLEDEFSQDVIRYNEVVRQFGFDSLEDFQNSVENHKKNIQ